MVLLTWKCSAWATSSFSNPSLPLVFFSSTWPAMIVVIIVTAWSVTCELVPVLSLVLPGVPRLYCLVGSMLGDVSADEPGIHHIACVGILPWLPCGLGLDEGSQLQPHITGHIPVLLHSLALYLLDLPLQSIILTFLHLKLSPSRVSRSTPTHLLIETLSCINPIEVCKYHKPYQTCQSRVSPVGSSWSRLSPLLPFILLLD